MMFVIRRLQKLVRTKQIPLYAFFIDLTKGYDSVDRTFLWTVLACFGVPHNMISAIRQFHDDGMRACVRLDDRVCSGWFTAEQGLRQECVLTPLLFNIFAAITNVTHTRFKADKDIMDALFGPFEKEKGGGGGGGKQLPESQSWRRRFGVCFTLTMLGPSCNHPSSRER